MATIVLTPSAPTEGTFSENLRVRLESLILELSYELNISYISTGDIISKVERGLTEATSEEDIMNLVAETSASLTAKHPDYSLLAGRICMKQLHTRTSDSFTETVRMLYKHRHPDTGVHAPLVSAELLQSAECFEWLIQDVIDYNRDYDYDYFAYKTLVKSYLLKSDETIERPQHMLMRVALGIYGQDIHQALAIYKLMSERIYTHASPVLFNAGTPKPQLSSCFLVQLKGDKPDDLYDTLKTCGLISRFAGGIGLNIHNMKAKGAYDEEVNGVSEGIVPALRLFNNTVRYAEQGGGKRKGAIAVYLEPWHADVFEFLELKKNHGKEELRARDLFYALWIPDLFMKRVEENGDWALFSPENAPGLDNTYGEEFECLYEKYEQEGKFRRKVKARTLWDAILRAQIETGTPYIFYKDSINKKNNQRNLGVIKSSNLCAEIFEYTSADEIAVCNLASVALPKFAEGGIFNHHKLFDVIYKVVQALDRVIDVTYYPEERMRISNSRHRPVAVGVQGLADLFMQLRLPFDSDEAKILNKEIFETIYFAALTASNNMAKKLGPYATFEGSPASQGMLQFDLWGFRRHSGRWDWEQLKEEIMKYGIRNSLLTAPMPTATTSQLLGNSESFEPYASNIYVRRVSSGEFVVVNRYLVKELIEKGLWTEQVRQRIIAEDGSVQNIEGISEKQKAIYKTAWEISMRVIIDMAADRGAYICQGQSLNAYIANPTFGKLTSMHFYTWKRGLKTGMYYLRTKAASSPIKFTVNV